MKGPERRRVEHTHAPQGSSGIVWRLLAVPLVAVALAAFATPSQQAEAVPQCVDLLAGQTTLVGEVCVDNDGTDLTVTYTITEGDWQIVETHLAVSTDGPPAGEWSANKWVNKSGNPAPGQFPYSETHDPSVTTFTYTIPLADLGTGPGDLVFVAAHAVVQLETVLAEATGPYAATSVVESTQGLRANGTVVLPERSDPTEGLVQDYISGDATTFYSLGFGGSIVVEFDCPIQNGEGDDLSIFEVTNGDYPTETATVEVSTDGVDWTLLGNADNEPNPDGDGVIESTFDLGDLASARYVRITDTSDSTIFEDIADAFDLDGVEAIHDCRIVEIEEETAWGAGTRFVTRGNWATYFQYEVQEES